MFRIPFGSRHADFATRLSREIARADQQPAQVSGGEGKDRISDSQLRDLIHSPQLETSEKVDGFAHVAFHQQHFSVEQRLSYARLLAELVDSVRLGFDERKSLLGALYHLGREHPLPAGHPLGHELIESERNLRLRLGHSPLTDMPKDLYQEMTEQGALPSQALSALATVEPQLQQSMPPEVRKRSEAQQEVDKALGTLRGIRPADTQDYRDMLRDTLHSLSTQVIALDRPDRDCSRLAASERSPRSQLISALIREQAQEPKTQPHILFPLLLEVRALPRSQQTELLEDALMAMQASKKPEGLHFIQQMLERLPTLDQQRLYNRYPHEPRALEIGGLHPAQVHQQAGAVFRQLESVLTSGQAERATAPIMEALLGMANSPFVRHLQPPLDPRALVRHSIAALPGIADDDKPLMMQQLSQAITTLLPAEAQQPLLKALAATADALSPRQQVQLQAPFIALLTDITEQHRIARRCLATLQATASPVDKLEMIKQIAEPLPAMNAFCREKGIDQPFFQKALEQLVREARGLPHHTVSPKLTDALVQAYNQHAEGDPGLFREILALIDLAGRSGMRYPEEPHVGQQRPQFHSEEPVDHRRSQANEAMRDFLRQSDSQTRLDYLGHGFSLLGGMRSQERFLVDFHLQLDLVSRLGLREASTAPQLKTLASVFSDALGVLRQQDIPREAKNRLTQALREEETRLLPAKYHHRSDFRGHIYDFLARVK
ncbi:hypothetical protein ACKC9G_15140 [Pokkaliibacter sp. CJK22405]|uniref:hypothetical protein n=1 Tax=Pokkaliibacter sp. CJK22405 TaxID=3384615 RepID=UPI003984FFCE